jgi:hypothetical protein
MNELFSIWKWLGHLHYPNYNCNNKRRQTKEQTNIFQSTIFLLLLQCDFAYNYRTKNVTPKFCLHWLTDWLHGQQTLKFGVEGVGCFCEGLKHCEWALKITVTIFFFAENVSLLLFTFYSLEIIPAAAES